MFYLTVGFNGFLWGDGSKFCLNTLDFLVSLEKNSQFELLLLQNIRVTDNGRSPFFSESSTQIIDCNPERHTVRVFCTSSAFRSHEVSL